MVYRVELTQVYGFEISSKDIKVPSDKGYLGHVAMHCKKQAFVLSMLFSICSKMEIVNFKLTTIIDFSQGLPFDSKQYFLFHLNDAA